jgi:CheY-like chemotaxis protein
MPTSPGRAARARQVRPRGRWHVALLGALAAHVLARRVLAGHVLAGVALVGGLGCGAGVIGDPPTLGGGRPTSRPRPTGSPVPSPTPTPTPTPSPTPTPTPPRPGTLDVTLTVKETAGVGALGYPVSAVVPLPYGMHQDTSAFRVAREDGTSVPAQFEVLNPPLGKRSLAAPCGGALPGRRRRVRRRQQPAWRAITSATTAPPVAPPIPVRVEDGADAIVVDTGKIQLRIGKRPFSIGTPAGPLEATFLDARGGRQRSFAREDVVVTVEESGPLRAVIRAEALSRWSDTDPAHGWAIRLYAYADQSFVKVDYQLQNGATNVTFAGPLYFEGLELSLATGQAATPASVRAGPVSTDPGTLPLGALDAGPVRAMIRNFHQSWPNGLAVDADGTLRAELWPTWSAQDYRGQVSGTGLYWLNDMQAVVKEVLLDFGTSRSLDEQARLFQLHPVTTVPTAWYASTRVTLDLGGAFPVAARIGSGDRRRPDYQSYNQNADVQRGWREKFGWNAFGADLSRRDAPSTTGGWPYSALAGETSGGRALRVLVAEDDAAQRVAACRMLGALGHRVEHAATGLEAIAALDRSQFDVVFMDLDLPGVDGLEATRSIRESERRRGARPTPIVAVAPPEVVDEPLGAFGVDHVVAAPLSAGGLGDALRMLGQQHPSWSP